jgi:SpoIIAA-like
MTNLLPDPPDNVVGVAVRGHVEAEDYREVLGPALERALASHDKVRLLAVLGDEFEGYSAGAAWEDAKLGLGHWGARERIAVVTDRDRIHDAIRAVGWMLPGEVKLFPTAGREEAMAWLTAG